MSVSSRAAKRNSLLSTGGIAATRTGHLVTKCAVSVPDEHEHDSMRMPHKPMLLCIGVGRCVHSTEPTLDGQTVDHLLETSGPLASF